jgi:hypothetical protein
MRAIYNDFDDKLARIVGDAWATRRDIKAIAITVDEFAEMVRDLGIEESTGSTKYRKGDIIGEYYFNDQWYTIIADAEFYTTFFGSNSRFKFL